METTGNASIGPALIRLRSLDVVRGMVIVLMFVVNMSYDDAIPRWFGHAGWNDGRHGQWLADFVFPWFLFVVGAAVPFSMRSGRGQRLTPAGRIVAAARRGLFIYLLGVLLHIARTSQGRGGTPGVPISFGSLAHWDILPLIALGYVVAVVLWHTPAWAWWVFIGGVLMAKWWIMPDLTAAVGLDRPAWMSSRTDPEHAIRGLGWWGTLLTQGMPAAATTVGGMIVGEWVWRARQDRAAASRPMVLAAGMCAAATAAAIVLAAVGSLPFSKDFFTSTYVLVSIGTGGLLLMGVFVALDQRRWDRFRPVNAAASFFEAFGLNAIAMYLVAEFTWTMVWTRWRVMAPDGVGYEMWASWKAWCRVPFGNAGVWIAIVGYVLIYYALAAWMRRRGIIVKV